MHKQVDDKIQEANNAVGGAGTYVTFMGLLRFFEPSRSSSEPETEVDGEAENPCVNDGAPWLVRLAKPLLGP